MSEVIIKNRFCGPAQSGNGGYTVGLLASELGFNAEVTLRVPPPLDRPLQLVKNADGIKLMDGNMLVAEAKPCDLKLDILTPPSFNEAVEAEKNFRCYEEHSFPTCFVCGPHRKAGDGLRLFAGTYDNSPAQGMVAASWQPDESFAKAGGADDGNIDPLYIISALDCPGFYAQPFRGKALLGRMQVKVTGKLKVGEKAVVAAWHLGHEGRKYYAGSAVYNASGDAIASGYATWISID